MALDCFDASGKKIRILQFTNYTREHSHCSERQWKVTDLVNNKKQNGKGKEKEERSNK